MCRVFSCVFGRGCCYDQRVLLAKLYQPLPCFILYSQAKFACYSRYLLTFYFALQSPIMKRTSFLGFSSRSSCKSSQNHSTSASLALLFEAQTWITVILNGLPWKRTEIFLLFLRLCPSTAFQTLLLTMMAAPSLPRDSCGISSLLSPAFSVLLTCSPFRPLLKFLLCSRFLPVQNPPHNLETSQYERFGCSR